MADLYVKVDSLPLSLRSALESVHYCRKDISVEVVETVSMHQASGQGRRAFERKILAIFHNLKPFARKDYLAENKVTPVEVDSLVSRGYLSRNKAGATQITTEGKNAKGNAKYY